MDKQILFFKSFLESPKETGSVIPSSIFLVNQMLKDVDFKAAECIVEYGPGTGCITSEILRRAGKDTKIICFETNKRFCNYLKKNFKDKRLVLINDSAENIDSNLNNLGITQVDYVVSGLPFANFPDSTKNNIIRETKNALKPGGRFVTYQYLNNLKKFLSKSFPKISTKFVAFNIPPCFVYVCEKQSK